MPDAYSSALDAMRRFHDRFVGSCPDDATLGALTADLDRWSNLLSGAAADEKAQYSGNRYDLPSRGRIMAPPVTLTAIDEMAFSGTVTFGRYYLGGNMAAHGGAIALFFDEALGRMINFGTDSERGWRARTAYLTTNYRSVVPLDAMLDARGRVIKRDGRKRFVRGELWHGGTLCADAEALFVDLKPGQP